MEGTGLPEQLGVIFFLSSKGAAGEMSDDASGEL